MFFSMKFDRRCKKTRGAYYCGMRQRISTTKKLTFFVGEIYTKYNDVVCANNFGRDQKKHAKIIPKCISSNKNQ